MKRHKQVTNSYKNTKLIILYGIILLLVSCVKKNQVEDNLISNIVPLPDILTEIQDSDLSPIMDMIGDAKIIGVTEGTHYANEPLDFRNELIKFLVKKKRIDVVAIESGIIESKYIFDYVNGRKGNIDSILYNGISWTFDKLPQNKELITWLRTYNADTTNSHKVKLYGFDVPGSPANPFANRKMYTAITEALLYLKVVDHDKWKEFESKLKPYIEFIHINYFNANDKSNQYIHLTETDRNNLTEIISDLIKLYEINELHYIKQSTKEDYEWAYLAANCSKQVDDFLRVTPLNYKIPLNIEELYTTDFLFNQQSTRDLSMFANFDWIIKREHDPNILLFAALRHLKKSPATLKEKGTLKTFQIDDFGQFLSSKFEEEYKVIGNFYLNSIIEDDSTKVDNDALENFLIHNNYKNYYKLITDADKDFMNKEWKFGEDLFNLSFYMNPYNEVDIIFFNQIQTQINL